MAARRRHCPRAGCARPPGSRMARILPPGVIDLEQPEDHVDEHDQPEADGRVDAPRDLLHGAHQPAHVEMLGPQRRHADAVGLQPRRRLPVEELQPRRVGDEPSSHPPEAPGDERGKDDEHDDDGERSRWPERGACGRCACRRLCIGHTMAMMKRAQATGARTALAKCSRSEDRDDCDQAHHRAHPAVSCHAAPQSSMSWLPRQRSPPGFFGDRPLKQRLRRAECGSELVFLLSATSEVLMTRGLKRLDLRQHLVRRRALDQHEQGRRTLRNGLAEAS